MLMFFPHFSRKITQTSNNFSAIKKKQKKKKKHTSKFSCMSPKKEDKTLVECENIGMDATGFSSLKNISQSM